MKQIGSKGSAKYWGEYILKDKVELDKPVVCDSQKIGKAYFKPIIGKLEWVKKPPSADQHDIWFTYWITIHGQEKYGQYAPMIGQKALLELMTKAIRKGFFTEKFLRGLRDSIEKKLAQPGSKLDKTIQKVGIGKIPNNVAFNKMRKQLDSVRSLTSIRMDSLIKYKKGSDNIIWIYYPKGPKAKVFQVLLKDAKYPRSMTKALSNWGKRGGYNRKYPLVYIRDSRDADIVIDLVKDLLGRI